MEDRKQHVFKSHQLTIPPGHERPRLPVDHPHRAPSHALPLLTCETGGIIQLFSDFHFVLIRYITTYQFKNIYMHSGKR